MSSLRLLNDPGRAIELPSSGSLPAEWHLFEKPTIQAVNAALAARRPLLVRGDPGVGKSQLARAAARQLDRAFISFVVDARTEARDLLYGFDAVQRLADAQVYGHTHRNAPDKCRELLAESNYLRPGPFWWAFDWTSAEKAAAGTASLLREKPKDWQVEHGCVVLIDEIDKGESDVPNGLLEVLGSREFTPQGSATPITIQGAPPLVVITTNAERILPDAFLRRCFVLSLALPEDREELLDVLRTRAYAHFSHVDKTAIEAAAILLADARKDSTESPRPGQAEFFDLIRAVDEIKETPEEQIAHLSQISRYAFNKRDGLV